MARPEEVFFGWMRGRQFRLTKNYGDYNPRWQAYGKGTVVKAVMVSRMGDVGVTTDLSAENGYHLRVQPYELEPVEPVPTDICPVCFCVLAGHDHATCTRDRKCETCGGETGPCDPKCPKCLLDEWRAGRG